MNKAKAIKLQLEQTIESLKIMQLQESKDLYYAKGYNSGLNDASELIKKDLEFIETIEKI